MADSTSTPKTRRPRKTSDFPLYVHKASGFWCKTVGSKRHYFEKVANDPDGKKSLDAWLDNRDNYLAGRNPVKADAIRVKNLCNDWLTLKTNKLNAGELAKRSFDEYKSTTDFVIEQLGKDRAADDIGPNDFAKMRTALAEHWGVNRVTKHISQIRSLFKHAWESGLLEKPAKFGPGFAKPAAKVMRQHRIAKGQQDFTADEIRSLLRLAKPNLRAMILLGVQGGFGNTDVAELPLSAVDLDGGWVDYPRAKTATHRRVPLWPETVEAIREVLAIRPKLESPYLFVSSRGNDYTDAGRSGYRIGGTFVKTSRPAGIADKGFYCLRRTFQTVGEIARDLVAVQAIMGHINSERDMSARYRQRVDDERLKAVTDCVRQWLLPIPKAGEVAQ